MLANGSSKALPRVIEGKLSALNGAMQHGNTEPLAVMYITVQGRMQRAHGLVSVRLLDALRRRGGAGGFEAQAQLLGQRLAGLDNLFFLRL